MTSLYWVKWMSTAFYLTKDSSRQGFEEMQDMFRYTGDMPCRVHYTPPAQDSPFGWFHVEMVSRDSKQMLESRFFRRWKSFGAFTKFVDYINMTPEFKKYSYNPQKTKELFDSLLAKNEMGMYADW